MDEHPRRYLAVIGDLVDSKKISDRAGLQEKLHQGFSMLSNQPSVVSPFTITLGDEFQAVFGSGEGLFASLFATRQLLYPVKCRFSIGIGTLSTEINAEQAIGMDGPAFHNAREGITELKAEKTLLTIKGLSRSMRALIDPLIKILWASTENWKANRLEVLEGLIDGQTERALANRLDLSERAIYKNIKDGQLREWIGLIHEVEMRMTKVLDT
ncbi:MAG: SatD family protein [Verrucomicrobiota bacterium]